MSPSNLLFNSITSATRLDTRSHNSPSVSMLSAVALWRTCLRSAADMASSRPLPSVSRPSAPSWCTMASPSAVTWRSHSIAYLPAIAALKADAAFSTIPFAASWSPRWAIGRAVSHSRPRMKSGDLEQAFDFDGRVHGKRGDADGRSRMPPLVAEHLHHEVRGAVHHL